VTRRRQSGTPPTPNLERSLLRKLAIAVLAVPILSIVYLSTLLGRSLVVRSAFAIGLGAILAFGVIFTMRPADTTATPPSSILPVTAGTFRTVVATDHALGAPVTLEFSAPMDKTSVAASVAVSPATKVALSWDADGRVLTIRPQGRWASGTYHTVTVDAGALAASGAPMASPVRAAFLTRGPAGAKIDATQGVGKRVSVASAFAITFDRPVDSSSVLASIHLEPAATGSIAASSSGAGLATYTFTPSSPLKANTQYRIVVAGAEDTEGVAIDPATLEIRTVAAPGVVRFRPLNDTSKVARDAVISVRFTKAMEKATTKAAFKVTAGGKAIDGKISFAEGNKVLVFKPAKKLPYGKKIVMEVGAAALSAEGVSMAKAAKGDFKTIGKAKHVTTTSSGGSTGGGGGGGAVGGGSWASVETYYLGLMNCTRTGGWVTSGGHCSSPGGRAVAPLKLDKGISSKVSRPYARKLALGADCSHFMGGNPGDRLRRAGYKNYTWAENLGCRSGNARGAVLGSHRFFQAEKSYNGGHYVNLMNKKYDRVGIGVWVSHGRVRLVIDFYHP
jgi:uncharacterized protein YkwD